MSALHSHEALIGELAVAPERVLGRSALDATLHYCSPAHGGWGVVRAALLVPDSFLLFVCPAACGRHGAIAALEQGYKDRVGYLCIDEREIVLGGYEAEIRRGAAEVLRRVRPRPRALMICVSCIDDLLATDHRTALHEMEAEHGLPIRLARMNPITLDGKLPPAQRIQRTMYEFLAPAARRDDGVILLGCFRPPPQDSELARFLSAVGLGLLRHPAFCADFDAFCSLARSRAALLLRPEGAAASEYLSTSLGMACLSAPIAFHEQTILERYRAIGAFAAGLAAGEGGRVVSGARMPAAAELVLREGREAAQAAAERVRGSLRGARVAIDSTASASPFNLALALIEAGLDVVRIYAERLPAHEKESFALLAEQRPGLIVANPIHARRAGRPAAALADVAIGFAAAYACGAPVSVPIAFDEGLYGFQGLRAVLEAALAAVGGQGAGLEEQVRAYGLVV